MRVARQLTVSLAAVVATVAATACGNDVDPSSEAAYCGQIADNLSELNAPAITTSGDIGLALTVWRSIADSAPLAIEPEWDTLVGAMETAITVDPDDPESLQEVADTARASEPAAKRIVSYTQERCGLSIGLSP